MSKNNIFFRKNLFVEIKFYVIMFILTNKYNIDIQDPKFDGQTAKTFLSVKPETAIFGLCSQKSSEFWQLYDSYCMGFSNPKNIHNSASKIFLNTGRFSLANSYCKSHTVWVIQYEFANENFPVFKKIFEADLWKFFWVRKTFEVCYWNLYEVSWFWVF